MSTTDFLLTAICVLSMANTMLAIYFWAHPIKPSDAYWRRIALVQSRAMEKDREARYWDSGIGQERRNYHAIVSMGMSLCDSGHIWRGGKND